MGFDSIFMDTHESGLALLAAAMGLEAALGAGSKGANVTDEVASRCAFRVEANNAERVKLMKEMRDFYKCRSDLAHGRIRRLRGEDLDWLYWGQKMLERVLKRELMGL